MVNDLLTLFKGVYEKHGDKLILDSYKPDEGIYICISHDDAWRSIVIRKDRDIAHEQELYNWFKCADYYSSLVDMNKPVDPKKTIHSNSFLSMFIKKDILPDVGESEKKLTYDGLEESIERYFEVFTRSGKERYNDAQVLGMLEEAKLPDIPVERIKFNKTYILSNIGRLIELVKTSNLSKKDYVKVFFDSELVDYIVEGKRYLIPKIFNKKDYNVLVGSNTYGLSNGNMGMNSKKPYLEAMTTKFKVAFRVDIESALLEKKIFDWLECQEGNAVYIPYDFDFTSALGNTREKKPFYYIYFSRGTGLTIEDFDYLPNFSDQIEFKLYNYLNLEEGERDNRYVSEDRKIKSLFQLEDELNAYFFNGRLKNSYYQEPKIKAKEFSKTLLDLLIISRKSLHDYFKKGIDTNFKAVIDRVSLEAVKEQLRMAEGTWLTKPAKALNLRLSILKYLKLRGENMGDKIKNMIDTISNKLGADAPVFCENDDEFYFLSGQLAYYLLNQSEAAVKTNGMVEPFLRARTAEQMKRQLSFVYDRYKHAIPLNFSKFRGAMGAVQGYDTQSGLRLNMDMFISGFMSKNIFFVKNEQGVNIK